VRFASHYFKAFGLAALVWVACGFAIFFIGMKVFVTDSVARLSQNGHRSYGRVIGKQADDHERVDYEFVVDGTTYRGSGRGGRGNSSFDELSVGTTIIVTYDPIDPKVSFMGNPRNDLQRTEAVIRMVSVVGPGFPILTILLLYFVIVRVRASSA